MALFFFRKAVHYVAWDRIIWDVKAFLKGLLPKPVKPSRGAGKSRLFTTKKNYCISLG
jgi:hypothetical protein